jgi:hypothetical protein
MEHLPVWLADVDLSAAPSRCTPPPSKQACQPPPLPEGPSNPISGGDHLLAIAPEIWPSELVLFDATVAMNGTSLDLTLQSLDQVTRAPVGEAWVAGGGDGG